VFATLVPASAACAPADRGRASRVGDSATRAVVSGIILLVVVDGLFAVAYYLPTI